MAAALQLLGCGGGGDRGNVPVYPVTGTVTMFGSPLANATVAFAPLEGQPTAVGTTDTDGKFQLTTYDYADGAAVGTYKVVLSKAVATAAGGGASTAEHGPDYEDSGASTHAAAEGEPSSKSLVPSQYTTSADTPLTAEVKPGGDNNFTFEIK